MIPWQHTEYPDIDILDREMARTKGRLFLHGAGAGFLGSLLCDHEIIWDESCGTAWCDGARIGFNPAFFWWLTPAARVTVLAHELWHTGYDHMNRLGGRDPQDFNEAGDHVINLRLEEWGYEMTQLKQIGVHMDPIYANMTTEQVYDLIQQNKVPPPPCPAPGQGDPQPSSGQGQPSGGQGGSQPQEGLNGDVRAPETPLAATEVKGKIAKAIMASQMSKEAGIVPGEIQQIIDTFLNPILPWERLLSRFYTELSQDDYSWARPNRRHDTEYLPSLKGDNKLDHLVYYLDISGSITDRQIERFFSEVRHIHRDHTPKKITMVTFDVTIHDVFELTDEDPFKRFKITGRGGTCLREVRAHIEKHQPTAAVIFTDLGCRPMEKNPKVPLVWIVSGAPHRTAPFGKVIHIAGDA